MTSPRRVAISRFFAVVLGIAMLLGCGQPRPADRIMGSALGTSFTVEVIGSPVPTAELRDEVLAELRAIDDEASTWNANSTLSQVNRAKAGEPVAISPTLAELVRRGEALREATGGAFDPAVGPLVEAWNFGSRRSRDAVDAPSPERLAELRQAIADGYDLAADGSTLTKRSDLLELDYSAMAKGDVVDRIATLLQRRGVADWLVEVGGEVRVSQARTDGGPWRLGVARPERSPQDEVAPPLLPRSFDVPPTSWPAGFRPPQPLAIVPLRGEAMATSGDYRNYQTIGGERVSHVIDPRTGRPARSDVVSATVIAADCATADAYATALMVLGFEDALQWSDERGLDVLVVRRDADGTLELGQSEGMRERLGSGVD